VLKPSILTLGRGLGALGLTGGDPGLGGSGRMEE
jgi:hypothetical protein